MLVPPLLQVYLIWYLLMFLFFKEYIKHTALNFGQACQGIRYLFSHPDIDKLAPRGSFRHFYLSLPLRSKRVANDLFFAAIPPHWHHTPKQLEVMRTISIGKWFQYGYCAWKFTKDGKPKTDLTNVDKRWDPRCK